jgi:PAS domain S-box-containing protein
LSERDLREGLMGPDQPDFFEALATQIPEAIVFADRGGLIRFWNHGAQLVFGFAASEALGQSLDLIIPERLRPAHWTAYHRAIEDGRTRGGNEVRVTRSLHKDGRRLYVEMSFGLVVDEAGVVTGSVAVARDCSKRFAAEQALRQRVAELEAARPL